MAPHVTRHVLVTDYAWPSLEIERDGLGKIGAELVVASTGQEEELQARAIAKRPRSRPEAGPPSRASVPGCSPLAPRESVAAAAKKLLGRA